MHDELRRWVHGRIEFRVCEDGSHLHARLLNCLICNEDAIRLMKAQRHMKLRVQLFLLPLKILELNQSKRVGEVPVAPSEGVPKHAT